MIGRPSGVTGRKPAQLRATVNDASAGSRRTALRKIWASPSLVTTASNPACSMVLPRIASLPRIST